MSIDEPNFVRPFRSIKRFIEQDNVSDAVNVLREYGKQYAAFALAKAEAAKAPATDQPDDSTVITQACIESIIRRHATGWIMDKEQPMANYLFAKAEEMAKAILAVYPARVTERGAMQPVDHTDGCAIRQGQGCTCGFLKRESVTMSEKDREEAMLIMIGGYWRMPFDQIPVGASNIVTKDAAYPMLDALLERFELRRRGSV